MGLSAPLPCHPQSRRYFGQQRTEKMKLSAFAVVALLLIACPSSATKIRLCGRMLAEALSLLCSGSYYEPQQEGVQKRAAGSVPNWLLSQRTPRKVEYLSRQTRGVVDECCKEACSPSVLLAYCA